MADQEDAVQPPTRVALDGRRPKLLDHRGHALLMTAGYADVFAVSMIEGSTSSARHHLFRVESGEILLDLAQSADSAGNRIEVIAVGGPGAEARLLPRLEIRSPDLVATWITRLAGLDGGPEPGLGDARTGARRSHRDIAWRTVSRSRARHRLGRIAGRDGEADGTRSRTCRRRPAFAADVRDVARSRPIGLHSRREQQHAGWRGCYGAPSTNFMVAPWCASETIWRAMSPTRASAWFGAASSRPRRHSSSSTASPPIVVKRLGRVAVERDPSDPLQAACRIVAEASRAPFIAASRPASAEQESR